MAAPQPVVEVDDAETDSALGDDTQSATTSLAESIFNYRQEHGRTYHAYNDGKYWMPNDERESDRLDLQHHMFSLTYDGKLHFAPLRKDINNALDIGTGTGIWAMDFADDYPDCQVVGTDLSPTQPNFVPPNLRFLIDDAEDEWIFDNKFDYIHLRLMAGTFVDWQKVMRSAFEFLEPGGWLEIQDYDMPCFAIDDTLKGTDLELWATSMVEGCDKMGRPIALAQNYAKWMEEIGFVDIQEKEFLWPTNGWPRDKKLKELGRWCVVNLSDGMEGFSLAIFTRVLGWSKEEVEVLCAKVRSDLHNKAIHAYFRLPVIYGQKPL